MALAACMAHIGANALSFHPMVYIVNVGEVNQTSGYDIPSYGEHMFFHFTGAELLKITTKWLPGQIELQNAFLNRAVSCAIEIDQK